MAPIGLDHIVLRCRDVEAMERFYCDALCCTVERRVERLGLVHLRAGTALIDLVTVTGSLGEKGGAAPGVGGRNLDHFCLRIDPFDVEALRAHFARFGIAIGRVHRNFGAQGEGDAIYVDDPEGNTIELKSEARGAAWKP